MGRKSPIIQIGSLGAHPLRMRQLTPILGISRQDREGFTVAEYVAECLGKLGVELVQNSSTGDIILGKKGSSRERWWDELTVPDSVDIKIFGVENARYGYQKRFICNSLSALREVIHFIREAKLTTKPSRSRKEYLERLCTWGLASAIVLIQTVFRQVFVIGERRDDLRWCCEWMMGEVDENGESPERFLVDLPLRLVQGCSMQVITHGAFAVRIDVTKALKLMKVDQVYKKDLKVSVLRAGAGKTMGARSKKVRVAHGRYIRVRDCAAVITTEVLFPHLKHRSSGYSRSRRVIYLD